MPLPADESVVKTADTLVSSLRSAFGTPASHRPAHAKGHLLTGTFTPHPHAPTLSRAPHFASPSPPTKILARFSSSTGLPAIPDTDPSANPRGLALRFHLPDDSEGKRRHTDIIAHSTPYFPVRTGEGFLAFLRALGDGSVGDFLEGNAAAKAFVEAPKPSPVGFGTEAYYGVNAFKFVNARGEEKFVRYRIVPAAGVQTLSPAGLKAKEADYLSDELRSRFSGYGGIEFELVVQLAELGDVTDDATVLWPESREVVELGTIRLDALMGAEQGQELQKTVIFDPIPRVDGIEASGDPLLDMRAAIYLISGKGRRAADVGGEGEGGAGKETGVGVESVA